MFASTHLRKTLNESFAFIYLCRQQKHTAAQPQQNAEQEPQLSLHGQV